MIKEWMNSLVGRIVISAALCLMIFLIMRELREFYGMMLAFLIAIPCSVFSDYNKNRKLRKKGR
jgi:hypothetical protein